MSIYPDKLIKKRKGHKSPSHSSIKTDNKPERKKKMTAISEALNSGTVFIKFNIDDRVKYGEIKGTIIDFDINWGPIGGINYTVEFDADKDGKFLNPKRMSIAEKDLRKLDDKGSNSGLELDTEYHRYIDNIKFCPVCRTSWTETAGHMETWKDCLKCGKRREDIIR